MPPKCALLTICKGIFYFLLEHQVWFWERLVCGIVAKRETVLCAKSKTVYFGKGKEKAEVVQGPHSHPSLLAQKLSYVHNLLQNGNGR